MKLEELQKRVDVACVNGTIKVNIVHEDGQKEGVWACFCTPKDKEVYSLDNSGDTFEVYLMNSVLIRGQTWGAKLKLTVPGGDTRASIPVEDMISQIVEACKNGEYPLPDEFQNCT